MRDRRQHDRNEARGEGDYRISGKEREFIDPLQARSLDLGVDGLVIDRVEECQENPYDSRVVDMDTLSGHPVTRAIPFGIFVILRIFCCLRMSEIRSSVRLCARVSGIVALISFGGCRYDSDLWPFDAIRRNRR